MSHWLAACSVFVTWSGMFKDGIIIYSKCFTKGYLFNELSKACYLIF